MDEPTTTTVDNLGENMEKEMIKKIMLCRVCEITYTQERRPRSYAHGTIHDVQRQNKNSKKLKIL